MVTANDPHRGPYSIPVGAAPAREPVGDVVIFEPGGPVTEHTARAIAESLASIAASLARLANPEPVDVADQVRRSLQAMKEELPILGLALDSINAAAARRVEGTADVS